MKLLFIKKSPLRNDRSKVIDLLNRGARLAVDYGKENEFKKLGMDPDLEAKNPSKGHRL